MNNVLFLFLSLSISGSVLALVLLVLKPLIKNRLSQTWQYYIWLIVVLRFLLPFGPETSVVDEAAQHFQNIVNNSSAVVTQPEAGSEIGIDRTSTQPSNITVPESEQTSENNHLSAVTFVRWREILDYACLFWLGVGLVLLVHKVASYRSFVRFVKVGTKKITDVRVWEIYQDVHIEAKIKKALPLYLNAQISSPMLVGIFRPMVVIPPIEASIEEYRNIFRHELTHYRRMDFFYKWLVQIAVCLHWFNPLMYIIGKQINKNCELSCDEAVIKGLGKEERIAYGDALIKSLEAQGSYSDFVVAITMSENGNLVKERLNAIMNFGKQKKSTIVLSVILAAILFSGGYALGAYTNSSPLQETQQATDDGYSLTVYVNGEYISSDVLYLWNNVNNIYNVDDIEMFDMSDSGTFLYQNGPEFFELFNYDEIVDAYFTANGKAQLEETMIGGPYTLIQKKRQKIYRMGAWKTGYSYAEALDGAKVIRAVDDTIVLEMKYKKPGGANEPPNFDYANFTIKRMNDEWYVEDYVYPESRNKIEDTNDLDDLKPEILPVLQELIADYDNGDGVDFQTIPDYCALPVVETTDDFILSENEAGLSATILIDLEWQMDVLISDLGSVYKVSGTQFTIIPDSLMGKAMARGLSFSQVRTLINSGFTQDEILTLPIKEVKKVFEPQIDDTTEFDTETAPPEDTINNPSSFGMTDPYE